MKKDVKLKLPAEQCDVLDGIIPDRNRTATITGLIDIFIESVRADESITLKVLKRPEDLVLCLKPNVMNNAD